MYTKFTENAYSKPICSNLHQLSRSQINFNPQLLLLVNEEYFSIALLPISSTSQMSLLHMLYFFFCGGELDFTSDCSDDLRFKAM